MKESIGSTASLNIVLTFIAIVFAFLAGTLSYYKAFKVNNVIINSIEKFEGYNTLSRGEILTKLSGLGYQMVDSSCSETKNFNGEEFTLLKKDSDSDKGYCVYFYNNRKDKYYQYGIVTYMTINLPIISDFVRIPVNTVSDEIYGCYGYNDSYGEGKFSCLN